MARTTAKAFDEFNDKIALTPDQQQQVTKRADQAARYLAQYFGAGNITPVIGTQLMGSAARGTIIRPLDDIDILAEFRNKGGVFEQYRGKSQDFLYHIRATLDAKTQIQTVGARGQVVRLFYTGGPHVDIAPVFEWQGGGYALPAGDETWLTTDPVAQAVWINRRQEELSNLLKKRVRMLKRWNRVHGGRLQSFHLEVMVATVFSSMGADSRDALHVFFKAAPGNLIVKDPAGHGGDLSAYLSLGARVAAVQSFRTAGDRAANALAAERLGNHPEAIRLWRIILGDEFPSYG